MVGWDPITLDLCAALSWISRLLIQKAIQKLRFRAQLGLMPLAELLHPGASCKLEKSDERDLLESTGQVGKNPAPVDMVDIPMNYRVSYKSGGAGFLPFFHQHYDWILAY